MGVSPMFDTLKHRLKDFFIERIPQGTLSLLLPRTKYDYRKDVGEGLQSSSIMAPIQWIQRAFTESQFVMLRETDDEAENVPHPLIDLIRTPNAFHSEQEMWMATLLSWCLAGNAYWLKVPLNDRIGPPRELWWVPHWMMTAKWPLQRTAEQTTENFISHYEYNPGGLPINVPVESVVHFRHGLNPVAIRYGLSPLAAVLREVWSDDEASNFVASILRNDGVPGTVFSPKEGSAMPIDVKVMKDYITEHFTADRRGEPMVLGAPTDVRQFAWNPQQMDLSHIRNTAEERVCAALGIPSAVVGFGSGLETTKVGATMKEMRELAWQNGITPIQKAFARQVNAAFMRDFRMGSNERAAFDNSHVAALQDDRNELFTRANVGVTGGWLTVGEGKRMVGSKSTDRDEVYLRSIATVEVPAALGMQSPMDQPKHNGHDPTFKQDIPSPAEAAVIDRSPVRKPPQQLVRAVAALEDLSDKLSQRFARRIRRDFVELGKQAAAAAEELLEKAFKQSDEIDAELILQEIRFEDLNRALKGKYDQHFASMLEETFKGMNLGLGLTTDLPDGAALRVIETSGRRLGLVDLKGQTRKKLFALLKEGRELGEGRDLLVKRIRDEIPAGPWPDVRTRARVIARTETKYAQNVSMVEYTKATGVQHAMVFDARLGDTDETCEALNGRIVTLAEAEALVAEEHPNGSRSFTPWFEEMEV